MTNKTPNQSSPEIAVTTQNDSKQSVPHKTQTDSLFKSTPKNENSQNNEKSSVESNPKEVKKVKETTVLPVDINISGKVYTINCPADGVDELRAASKYINSFIQDIRKQAPQLTHENLLVLCCLNLYEYIQEIKKEDTANATTAKAANTLVEKMIKDMQIV